MIKRVNAKLRKSFKIVDNYEENPTEIIRCFTALYKQHVHYVAIYTNVHNIEYIICT